MKKQVIKTQVTKTQMMKTQVHENTSDYRVSYNFYQDSWHHMLAGMVGAYAAAFLAIVAVIACLKKYCNNS